MSLTIREVINQLTESGVDLDRHTNIEELKLKGADYVAVEFIGAAVGERSGLTQEDIDDAVSEIENAIDTLKSAKRSLK